MVARSCFPKAWAFGSRTHGALCGDLIPPFDELFSAFLCCLIVGARGIADGLGTVVLTPRGLQSLFDGSPCRLVLMGVWMKALTNFLFISYGYAAVAFEANTPFRLFLSSGSWFWNLYRVRLCLSFIAHHVGL